jgi:DNA polymerase elongation subunit (family B)
MWTFNQLWGVTHPHEAKAIIAEQSKEIGEPQNLEEQAIKLTMNSIYGAIGNNWFVCFNPDVAEAVTLQGQDLIKHSEKIIFRYFSEFWHNDKELHEKLGLTSVRKITRPMTIYGDTDSNYVAFQDVVSSCDWKGDPKDLVLKINEYRLKEYLNKCFELYSKKWGTTNYQDFELERISESIINIAKKKYIQHILFEDGIFVLEDDINNFGKFSLSTSSLFDIIIFLAFMIVLLSYKRFKLSKPF